MTDLLAVQKVHKVQKVLKVRKGIAEIMEVTLLH